MRVSGERARKKMDKGWEWRCDSLGLREWDSDANLPQTFKARASEIADHAHNPRGALGEGVEFLRGLDEMERLCMFPLLLAFSYSFIYLFPIS